MDQQNRPLFDDETTNPQPLWCPQCGFPASGADPKTKIMECSVCGYCYKTPNKPRKTK